MQSSANFLLRCACVVTGEGNPELGTGSACGGGWLTGRDLGGSIMIGFEIKPSLRDVYRGSCGWYCCWEGGGGG